MSSELPMPKSPFGQFPDIREGLSESEEIQQREREERGWWSLRFRQVLHDLLWRQEQLFTVITPVLNLSSS